MHNFAMFNYDYLFGDHFAKVSLKAKLLYVNLSFFANSGFVPNPKQICANLGFNESVLQELIDIEEILTIEGRQEMFLTSYFVHNPNFNCLNWTHTPYATYWRGKLWMKKNRIATFSKEKADVTLLEKDVTLPNSAAKTNVLDELDQIVSNQKEDQKDVLAEYNRVMAKQRRKETLTLEDQHWIFLYHNQKQINK